MMMQRVRKYTTYREEGYCATNDVVESTDKYHSNDDHDVDSDDYDKGETKFG